MEEIFLFLQKATAGHFHDLSALAILVLLRAVEV